MLGSMQDWPLLIARLIDHAATHHPHKEIVSLLPEGGTHRTNWKQLRTRAMALAQWLQKRDIRLGDRIGTLAWNTHRHLECWYGISGMGAVTHTINPRLFDEQISYIINHAEDRILFFDLHFLPLLERLAPQLPKVEAYVLLGGRTQMPAQSSLQLLCYEELFAEADPDFTWPDFPETTPSGLCYTSGTTGHPKGVLYSHRSTILHTLGANCADGLSVSARSVVLPIVPMFHANAWGIAHAATGCGAKLVLGGPHFEPAVLQKLIIDEGVTQTAAVPTIWLAMLNHLDKTAGHLGPLKQVVIGGSAMPRAMLEAFEQRYGVEVFHAWGMTEMSPLGTVGTLSSDTLAMPAAQQIEYKIKQGRALFGVEMRIADDHGRDLPHDGVAQGRLMVRGPWIVERYFRGDGGEILDAEGWFDTGDIATIDPLGYMQITDRAKDVIKSGGEWISSIDLENIAVGCPGVAEAAVIGLPHPKWDERPLLIVMKQEGSDLTKEKVLHWLEDKIIKWWMPDDVVFVEKIPHTATGKIHKLELRAQFAQYKLPTA